MNSSIYKINTETRKFKHSTHWPDNAEKLPHKTGSGAVISTIGVNVVGHSGCTCKIFTGTVTPSLWAAG